MSLPAQKAQGLLGLLFICSFAIAPTEMFDLSCVTPQLEIMRLVLAHS